MTNLARLADAGFVTEAPAPAARAEAEKAMIAKARRIAKIAAEHAADVDARSRFPQEAFDALKQERLLGIMVPQESIVLPLLNIMNQAGLSVGGLAKQMGGATVRFAKAHPILVALAVAAGAASGAFQLFQAQIDKTGEVKRFADGLGLTKKEMKEMLQEKTLKYYEQREAELGSDTMRELEKAIMLRVIDNKWMDHIDSMDQLRNGISLRAYAQRDPLIEYKFEAFDAFQIMIESIKEDVVRYILRVRIVEKPEERKIITAGSPDDIKKPVKVENKIGRNDPCPCGSGKKYKKCCGQGAV